ncbi:MAG: hypothetical protein KC544_12450, partial [Gemmatimonadetes bacterium]|nr:hypothetical protein [Gemmatimonadota bacterium]
MPRIQPRSGGATLDHLRHRNVGPVVAGDPERDLGPEPPVLPGSRIGEATRRSGPDRERSIPWQATAVPPHRAPRPLALDLDLDAAAAHEDRHAGIVPDPDHRLVLTESPDVFAVGKGHADVGVLRERGAAAGGEKHGCCEQGTGHGILRRGCCGDDSRYRSGMPPLRLDTPVQYLKGVGEKRAVALGRLGIERAQDLVLHLPHRYIDASNVTPLARAR